MEGKVFPNLKNIKFNGPNLGLSYRKQLVKKIMELNLEDSNDSDSTVEDIMSDTIKAIGLYKFNAKII